ncbi:MAG: hypothetical protein U0Q19_16610 [Kineosporiaceae bacterium]
MSTTTATPTQRQTPPMVGRPGIPFTRLVRLEARKLVDTRSGRWLMVSIALLTAGLLTAVIALRENGDELAFASLIEVTGLVQAALYPLMGILAMTAEFSQRTGLVTFTVEPRRIRVVAAKLLAASAWAVVGLGVAVGFAALGHLAAVQFRDAPAQWHVAGDALAGFVLAQVLSVVQGVAFGLLLSSPAVAIVAFLGLPTAWAILTSMISRLGRVATWLDLDRATDPLTSGSMTGEAWAHLGTASAVWVLVPLVIGSWWLTRREIN